MTTTKLTHEEKCELWAKARKAARKDCPWLTKQIIRDPFLLQISLHERIQNWGKEMEDRYGQDED